MIAYLLEFIHMQVRYVDVYNIIYNILAHIL